MNSARVAAALRLLADAIEDDDATSDEQVVAPAPASRPRRRRGYPTPPAGNADEATQQKIARRLRQRGFISKVESEP